jgi:N-acetylmuramoyl-L-alanine amidase
VSRRGRAAALWVLAAGLALAAIAAPAAAAPRRVRLEPGLTAVLSETGSLYLEAAPLSGEGVSAFARRLCGEDTAAARAILDANRGVRRLEAGRTYRVPYEVAAGELRLRAARALFPDDRAEYEGWRHRTRTDRGGESLWQIAMWFTGKGENFKTLREINGLRDNEPPAGAELLVPAELLRRELRASFPAAAPPGPAAAPQAVPPTQQAAAAPVPIDHPAAGPETYDLEYAEDAEGEHAIYPLRPGEALYSSVVVRFTGRLHAEDVSALAQTIAQRSGISDVTDIPIGYRVRIPLDLLLPEYLPAGHPRRKEYEAGLIASAAFQNRVRAVDLEGITVILDSGHGGRDVGATLDGVWESLYVYDVMLRVRQLLDSYSAAKVAPLIRDGKQFKIEDRDVLAFSRGHAVLTTPPYAIADSKVGVNLRWQLANSVHRRVVKGGGDPAKVVFISLHADSLHPSLRGAMAYLPEASLSGAAPANRGGEYASRKETREPRYQPSRRELQRSEGLSRDLANHLIAAFRDQGLAVHPFKPVREKVIRNRRQWVPAVLRYNAVPAKILLEICNLANHEDRKLLQTRSYRQKVAEAIVQGILGYYSPPANGGVQVAKAKK